MLSITGDVSCLVSEEAILRELTDALNIPPIFECVPPTEHSEGGLLFSHSDGTTFVTDMTCDAWLPLGAEKSPNEWLRFKYESALLSEGLDSAISGKDGFLRFASREKEQVLREVKQLLTAALKAVNELMDDNTEADQVQCAADTKLDSPRAVAAPKKYCFGWSEILNTLGRKNNKESRSLVSRLSRSPKHPGPIVFGGQGEQPRVDECKLLEWWNSLYEQFQKHQADEDDKAASVEGRYLYGRDAEVAPDLGGSVKKRRSTPVRSVTEHHQTSQNIE